VVDFQNVPPRDGLDHLFGDAAAEALLGSTVPVPPATRREAMAQLPSRRDLRAKSKGRARTGRAKPPAFVPPVDSAYPATRVIVVRQAAQPRKKSPASAFITVVAVVGLFGSVALPAYAMVPQGDGDSVADVNAELAADASADLTVSTDVALATTARGAFNATTASELKNQKRTAYMASNYEAYVASGAREKGDDYPWFSELSNNQGGGLSPLNYFYRECVDFVAWRLNRDAGSLKAPYLYTWSTLTPSGGNAYQWKRAWQNNGWETSTTPVAGSVAWYSYGHVAYVKSVNADGTITVEDYNQSGLHVYDIRTVAANDAQLYLYPPPR
jgi:surface antigen